MHSGSQCLGNAMLYFCNDQHHLRPSRRQVSTACTMIKRTAAKRIVLARPSASRSTSLPLASPDYTDCLHPSTASSVVANLLNRHSPLSPSIVEEIRQLHGQQSALSTQLQLLNQRRNQLSSLSVPARSSRSSSESSSGGNGSAAPSSSSATAALAEYAEEALSIKQNIKLLSPQLASISSLLHCLSLQLPNTAHPLTPIGSETSARVVRTFGPPIPSPPPSPDPARDHLHLSSPAQLGWTDFPSASLVAGSNWPYLMKDGALLEIALTNYAISETMKKGFEIVLTPDVVKWDIAERCGFMPREGEAQQTYFLTDRAASSSSSSSSDQEEQAGSIKLNPSSKGSASGSGDALCLVGTAEVPLVALSAASILPLSSLPRRSVALGRAFRAEAGARGSESRGLYRVHQFSKVEMVVLCAEEDSEGMLEELREVQETILGQLGLSLRVLEMPTQELGASAHRKYDIEAWMPGRGKWGELSSASNCTSYQSRRLSIRYRPAAPLSPSPASTHSSPSSSSPSPPSSSPQRLLFAHTLNATAAAIPRLIIALLENGAVLDAEGNVQKVRLPTVLRRFWLGDSGEGAAGGSGGIIEWVKEGEALWI